GSSFGGPVTLSGGTATSDPISSLSVGTHAVAATYSGDGNFSNSTSADFTQTVNSSPVTPATGGAAIPADNATNGTYTSLTGPIYQEPGNGGDVGTGTIILSVPSGFVFDTSGTAPTVLMTGSGNANKNINDLNSGSTI